MAKQTWILALLCVTVFGCGGKKDFAEPGIEKGARSYSTSETFSAPYQVVWNALQQAVENRGIPISQTVSDKGLILTEWVSGKSDRLYSGYGDTKIPYTVRYKYLIQVGRAESRTRVQIKSKEEFMTDIVTSGSTIDGSIYKWVPTESSGMKENQILQDVAELIAGVNN